MDITVKSIDDLPAAAQKFVSEIGENTVFAFSGPMGAGKTTFINEICRQLGVNNDPTASPTFAIINEYRSDDTAELIYHMDLYRVETIDEAMDLGIEDYLDCGAICFIEWPQIIDELLPDETVVVEIQPQPDGSRRISTRPID